MFPTINQLIKGARKAKKRRQRFVALGGKCFTKVVIKKVIKKKPKKPNSANRSVALVILKNKKIITASIPGEGHQLQEHFVCLIKAKGPKDLPSVNYTLVRGNRDFKGVTNRKTSRSKYGTPKV